jgi:ABC-2 type transport system ATP-binding protein
MEEAERLCDRVAILDQGRLIALDSPAALIRSIAHEKRVIFHLVDGKSEFAMEKVGGVSQVERDGERVCIHGSGDRFISSVVSALETNLVEFRDLRTEQPTLEDVFLQMTGRKMRD